MLEYIMNFKTTKIRIFIDGEEITDITKIGVLNPINSKPKVKHGKYILYVISIILIVISLFL